MPLFKDDLSPDSRPLLPTDEDQLNVQLSRNNHRPQVDRPHLHNISSGKELTMGQRSTSNRNMAEMFLAKSEVSQQQKALTDTNNFIEIFNRNESGKKVSINSKDNEPTLKEGYTLEQVDETVHNNNDDDQISLGSIDNTMENYTEDRQKGNDIVPEMKGNNEGPEVSDGLTMDQSTKKRYDEWADRGAAKIVQEMTNPKTGEKYKKLIKKGIKDFKFGEMIGDGAYSTVMLATSIDTNKKYAVKVLNKSYLIKQKKVKYVNIEKNALQRVNNSKCIIKLYFTFQDEASLYFLLEYAPNGDLLSLMKKFGSLNEMATCYYSAQIIDAIGYLHNNGIIHRDIKPENILLDKDWKIKLTDFGTAKILEQNPTTKKFDLLTRSKSFVGTAEYVSPELLNDSFVDYRCDIWAFGCILFQMIAGKPPFKATNEYLTFQKVMKVQYAFTAGFPTIVRDLVKRILIKQMNKRLSIADIEKHPFYKDKNFKDGSIWSDIVPELSAYKVSAKSMLPVPDLKDIYSNKRLDINHAKRSVSSAAISNTPVTTPSSTPNSPQLPRSNSSYAISAQKESISDKSDKNEPVSRKSTDGRTTAILENARRSVSSRKTSKGKHPVSGAALAASLAFNKKTATTTIDSNNTNTQSSSQSTMGSEESEKKQIHPSISSQYHNHTTNHNSHKHVASDISRPPTSAVKVARGTTPHPTTATGADNLKTNNDSEASLRSTTSPLINKQAAPYKSSPKPSENSLASSQSVSYATQMITKSAHASVNKLDIPWSFFLKDIGEHIIRINEFNIAIMDTVTLEKQLSRFHKAMNDPYNFNSSTRSTLLSQVARSGGEITGLRTGFRIPEDKYYESSNIDFDNVVDHYKTIGIDMQMLLASDAQSNNADEIIPVLPKEKKLISNAQENKSATQTNASQNTAEEDSGHLLFPGRVKKLFHHNRLATPPPTTMISIDHEQFMRRIVIITNYGRILTFVKRKSVSEENGLINCLCYDIDLCQMGLTVKEISFQNPANDLIVLQTPYKSFILSSIDGGNPEKKEHFNTLWLKTLKKAMKLGTDHKKRTHSKHSTGSSHTVHASPGISSSSIRSVDTVNTKNTIRHSPNASPISSPTLGKHTLSTNSLGSRSTSADSKRSLLLPTITDSTGNRKSRIFNSYVSSREKGGRRSSKLGIPTNSKLVNGLPTTSNNGILGLGISNSNDKNNSSNSSSSGLSKINFRYK
ncbi:similar to Saccharomyces cerevisiae YDR490C PKH1 Serine/threonine protein kinase involved in sphingolipid-mediated signaling pathway that controls endocytosis [Maudiozyma saulgeensis]|uniref:non-specific serine/threonine protein kinase n=1 Tax=Maudiozyma saulgeensis TaxID=1789683 RepID=A0A1X7R876_9SACH|nr:similar to Saccharomyces cerevisiae YDR490C PKH1 Serine/threonine protein kinase involved in sphingolipid-mediated signaling pathway that controls endocytosis [Kazachstania saulgeensis]